MSISGADDYIYKRCHHPHPHSCEPVILFFFFNIFILFIPAALGLHGHMRDI